MKDFMLKYTGGGSGRRRQPLFKLKRKRFNRRRGCTLITGLGCANRARLTTYILDEAASTLRVLAS